MQVKSAYGAYSLKRQFTKGNSGFQGLPTQGGDNSFDLQHPQLLRFAGGSEGPLAEAPFATVIEQPPSFDPDRPDSVKAYQQLLGQAQKLARPEVSGMPVGAIVIGNSGKAYMGANLEIKGGLPSETVHAEAFALLHARAKGESGIQAIIQTLRPCGSCRQVLLEAGNPNLPVHVIDMKTGKVDTRTAADYLPNSYHYASLDKNLFQVPRLDISELDISESAKLQSASLFQQARQSALQSYLPNPGRKTWAGISAKTIDDKQYQGCALTIPAPNNTIGPVQDLFVRMAADHQPLASLESVVMVEPACPDYSFRKLTKQTLKRVAPQASFQSASIPGQGTS